MIKPRSDQSVDRKCIRNAIVHEDSSARTWIVLFEFKFGGIWNLRYIALTQIYEISTYTYISTNINKC